MAPLVRKPLTFFLCLYAFCVPFDASLDVTPAGTVTKFIGACVVFLELIALILGHRRIARPSRDILGWTLFQLFSTASLAWAINPYDSLGYLVTVTQLFLLYAIVSLTPLPWSDVRLILYSQVAGGATLAAYSVYLMSKGGGGRLMVSLGSDVNDPNHTGAALLLPIALTLILAARQPWTRRLPLLGLLCLLLSTIYATISRGSVVGVLAILIYYVIRSRRRLMSASILAVIGIALVTIPNDVLQRFMGDNGEGSGRGSLWMVALEGFKQHWLYGAGIWNFSYVYDEFFIRTGMHSFDGWHRPAHSLIFSMSVELGIIGLALLAFAAFSQARALRMVARDHPLYDFRVALEAGMIGVLVSALFLDVMYHKYTWCAFMMVSLLRLAVTYAPVPARSAPPPFQRPIFAGALRP